MNRESKKTVSVVIPTYNRKQYIRSAIESVLNQTRPADEIIIVDDGSTDDTKEAIADLLTNERIKYIHQENLGISAARNTGVQNTSGDYVAFLDSDDFWSPHKLSKQLALFEANPELGLVHNYFECITANSEHHPPIFIADAEGWCFEYLVTGCHILTSAAMLSRHAIDKTGAFDTYLKTNEDYEYFMRIVSHFEIGLIKETLTFYRVHESGISRSVIELEFYKIIAFNRLLSKIPRQLKWHLMIRNQKALSYYRIARRFALKENDRHNGLEFIPESVAA